MSRHTRGMRYPLPDSTFQRKLPLYLLIGFVIAITLTLMVHMFINGSLVEDGPGTAAVLAKTRCKYVDEIGKNRPKVWFRFQENIATSSALDGKNGRLGMAAGDFSLEEMSPLSVFPGCKGSKSLRLAKGGHVKSTVLQFTQGVYTVGFWIRVDGSGASGVVLESKRRDINFDGFSVNLEKAGEGAAASTVVTFQCGTGSKWSKLEGESLISQWNHVVVQYDGDKMKIYQDGNLISQKVAKCIASENGLLNIGSDVHQMDGSILVSEVMLFDYTLSQKTIQNHFQSAKI